MSRSFALTLGLATLVCAAAQAAADEAPIPTVEAGLRAWRVNAFNQSLWHFGGARPEFRYRTAGEEHRAELSFKGGDDVREVDGALFVKVGSKDFVRVDDLEQTQLERYWHEMEWSKRYADPGEEPARLARVRAFRQVMHEAGFTSGKVIDEVWDVKPGDPNVDAVLVARLGGTPDKYEPRRLAWDDIQLPFGPDIRAAVERADLPAALRERTWPGVVHPDTLPVPSVERGLRPERIFAFAEAMGMKFVAGGRAFQLDNITEVATLQPLRDVEERSGELYVWPRWAEGFVRAEATEAQVQDYQKRIAEKADRHSLPGAGLRREAMVREYRRVVFEHDPRLLHARLWNLIHENGTLYPQTIRDDGYQDIGGLDGLSPVEIARVLAAGDRAEIEATEQWTQRHGDSAHGRRVAAAGLLKDALLFEGAVVGGGHLGPLLAAVYQIAHFVHRDGLWEVRREGDPRVYSFKHLKRADGSTVDPALFGPKPAELAAEPQAEKDRRARVARLRELLGDPKPKDLAGRLAGDGADHHAVSSVDVTDASHGADGWHLTSEGKDLRFLDEDPATHVAFSLVYKEFPWTKRGRSGTSVLSRPVRRK